MADLEMIGLVLSVVAMALGALAFARTRARYRQLARLRVEQGAGQALAIVESTPDFVATLDTEGHAIYLNQAGRRMIGLDEDEPASRVNIVRSTATWARDVLTREALPTALSQGIWIGESALLGPRVREIPVSQVLVAHRDDAGNVDYLSTIARDITDQKRLQSQLVHVATHDPLTNLLNRRRFEEELDRQVSESARYGTGAAIVLVDLDGLKRINDGLGHQVGDQVLISVGQLVRKVLRDSDIVARLGGDEFGLVLPRVDAQTAIATMQRLLSQVRRHNILVDGEGIGATASAGIAMIPDHGGTAAELMVNADLALYEAKSTRDEVCLYTSELAAKARFTHHRVWEQRIRAALEKDLFALHAQPIKSLASGPDHYELLLRMRDENDKVFAPDTFLPVAERSGLINLIDRWVVTKAINLIGQQSALGRELRLSVNLSGKAFADRELLPMIQRQIAATGADPTHLVFEITESTVIADLSNAQRFMQTLKSLGAQFALDDFGVGFSSFLYLKQLPVDYLKIDGSFIANLPNDAIDQHLVRSMAQLAHDLGKKTVAEFVGSAETIRLLEEYGIDYVQGYFVGPPRSIWDVVPRLGVRHWPADQTKRAS